MPSLYTVVSRQHPARPKSARQANKQLNLKEGGHEEGETEDKVNIVCEPCRCLLSC
jgi:hypothetical protein